jgi:hypothetical protein
MIGASPTTAVTVFALVVLGVLFAPVVAFGVLIFREYFWPGTRNLDGDDPDLPNRHVYEPIEGTNLIAMDAETHRRTHAGENLNPRR